MVLASLGSSFAAARHGGGASRHGARRRSSAASARGDLRCSLQGERATPTSSAASRQLVSCLAASLVFITPPGQAVRAETFAQLSFCQVAAAPAIDGDAVPLKFESSSDDTSTTMKTKMKGTTHIAWVAAIDGEAVPLKFKSSSNHTSSTMKTTTMMKGMAQVAAVAAAIDGDAVPLKFESSSDDTNSMMMMKGMTAKNFDPVRYSGRWFEVASLKRGFAGQGQEDCHCTQGVYSFDEKARSIQVETFCVHGSPEGYITGIRGRVQCLSDEDMAAAATDLEREEMIRSKCFLRFPTLPFIPKLPYDVLDTDYDNFAVVSGAKDTSFIQIYSRTPNPGPEFIGKYKAYAARLGYDPSKIQDTPQDCEVSSEQLARMMSMPAMEEALTNQFPPELKLKGPVRLDPFTSVSDTLKKLAELYFK